MYVIRLIVLGFIAGVSGQFQDFSGRCCNVALSDSTLDTKNISIGYNSNITACGQAYNRQTSPTNPVSVSYAWCNSNCPGWGISKSTSEDLNQWLQPVVGFILPAVIFSLTIPRSNKISVPPELFGLDTKDLSKLFLMLKIFQTLLFFLLAMLIVVVDTLIWVPWIFVYSGPMLVSGIYEALIDYRIVGKPGKYKLQGPEYAKALLVVLVGNLRMNATQQDELFHAMIDPDQQRQSRMRLKAVMESQYSFGTLVGAPVLFYLGAFSYSIIDIASRLGDNDTSHALSFGMWWMSIVHTAIISGCLLASNNPNTLWGMTLQEHWIDSDWEKLPRHPMREWIPEWIPKYRRIYEDTPVPVSLWKRGRNKRIWARNVLNGPDNRLVSLSDMFSIVGVPAFSLVFIPSGLAFVTSYLTPQIGLGCRSLTVLVYTLAQLLLIIRSLWYNIITEGYVTEGPITKFAFSTLWVVAITAAIFSGIGGTMMQLIGVYRSCFCFVAAQYWNDLSNVDTAIVQLATDTQIAREYARWWAWLGYGAVGFMALTTYIGWWYHRHLRIAFRNAVDVLWESAGSPLRGAQERPLLPPPSPRSSATVGELRGRRMS